MTADTTETVAEHSARLQPSINLHAPVTAFMFSCSGTQCTTPEGMKARVSPVQWSKPYSIFVPTQDSNPGGRIQNHKRWPLHYHCTLIVPFLNGGGARRGGGHDVSGDLHTHVKCTVTCESHAWYVLILLATADGWGEIWVAHESWIPWVNPISKNYNILYSTMN